MWSRVRVPNPTGESLRPKWVDPRHRQLLWALQLFGADVTRLPQHRPGANGSFLAFFVRTKGHREARGSMLAAGTSAPGALLPYRRTRTVAKGRIFPIRQTRPAKPAICAIPPFIGSAGRSAPGSPLT